MGHTRDDAAHKVDALGRAVNDPLRATADTRPVRTRLIEFVGETDGITAQPHMRQVSKTMRANIGELCAPSINTFEGSKQGPSDLKPWDCLPHSMETLNGHGIQITVIEIYGSLRCLRPTQQFHIGKTGKSLWRRMLRICQASILAPNPSGPCLMISNQLHFVRYRGAQISECAAQSWPHWRGPLCNSKEASWLLFRSSFGLFRRHWLGLLYCRGCCRCNGRRL